MISSIFLSVFLVNSCADDLENIRHPSKAIVRVQPPRFSSAELVERLGLPELVPGKKDISGRQRFPAIVATLLKTKDLGIFAVTSRDRSRFERIEIYGFDQMPRLLLVLEVDSYLDTQLSFPARDHEIYTALAGAKWFEDFLVAKKVLANQSPQQRAEWAAQMKLQLDEEIEKSDKPSRTMDDVEMEVYKARFEKELQVEYNGGGDPALLKHLLKKEPSSKAKKGAVPDPDGSEIVTARFGGYLPSQQKAAAILQTFPIGQGFGIEIWLNDEYRVFRDPRFPTVGRQIALERRFLMEWLELKDPQWIEVDSHSSRQWLYMIFERESDIPPNLTYHKMDGFGHRQ